MQVYKLYGITTVVFSQGCACMHGWVKSDLQWLMEAEVWIRVMGHGEHLQAQMSNCTVVHVFHCLSVTLKCQISSSHSVIMEVSSWPHTQYHIFLFKKKYEKDIFIYSLNCYVLFLVHEFSILKTSCIVDLTLSFFISLLSKCCLWAFSNSECLVT